MTENPFEQLIDCAEATFVTHKQCRHSFADTDGDELRMCYLGAAWYACNNDEIPVLDLIKLPDPNASIAKKFGIEEQFVEWIIDLNDNHYLTHEEITEILKQGPDALEEVVNDDEEDEEFDDGWGNYD